MARLKRPQWQVEERRQKIFQATLELFDREGFQEVSMRKIAQRARCSPTTIYNYYPSKDSLYLDVLKRGFEILYDLLSQQPSAENPLQTIRRFTQTFLWFSQEYPHYYDLMFSWPVPKFLDYVGTPLQDKAWEEKAVALRSLTLLEDVITQGVIQGLFRQNLDVAAQGRLLLGLCHGIIALHRAHIWPELDTEFPELYHTAVENFLAGLLANPSEGL
ncbi:MAG: TetR/AcrR family transcriptional regulator [Firmicutes bacterium]|nr:TetR/AcrR family transcriptional regulator [Bacillota bacterium]MCL5040735.1 TetR/AcrR family transcriptional regulator [Bacillota bacterium]